MAGVTGSLPPDEPAEPPDPAQSPDDAGIAGSVTGEWVEVYQPDGAVDLPPPAPAVTSARYGVLTVVLFVVALLLVIVGSVTPLFNAAIPLFGDDSTTNPADVLSADAWQMHTSTSSINPGLATANPSVFRMPVPIGYPLVLAALLLLAAVVLWLRAGQRPAALRAARPVGIVAAAFLAGLVLALGMFELAWDHLGRSPLFTGLSTGVGSGYWTLLASAGVAVAAAVLAYRVVTPEPEAQPTEWSAAEPDDGVPPGQPPDWPVVAVIPTDDRTEW